MASSKKVAKATSVKRAAKSTAPKKVVKTKAAATKGAGFVGFGYKTGWLAFKTEGVAAVAKAVGASLKRPCSWQQGVGAMYDEQGAFLSQSVDGWVLLADRELMGAMDHAKETITAVRQLSKTLGTVVQLFTTFRIVEMHAWVLADRGKLVRAFGYVGESGTIVVDQGQPTPAESGLALTDGDVDVDEETVMKLAGAWSVDPSTLDDRAGTSSGFTIPQLKIPAFRCGR